MSGIEKIEIFWGDDKKFEDAISSLDNCQSLSDILDIISKKEIAIEGLKTDVNTNPKTIENLIIYTDDYGGVMEWAILGFTNNILNHSKISIKNLWLCNPPDKIYEDIKKNNKPIIIHEHPTEYPLVTLQDMKKIALGYDEAVIGQPHVIKKLLSSIYSLKNNNRKRPVTILFLGDSGVGKTETAKYISDCLNANMVRIQFSMQQTESAYQYIFGAEHGENSLARELIRRKSNVILFDEYDKVSPLFYNAFYQMFDEGSFVDSNYTVNVSKCIIICTTNYRTEEEAEKNLGTPIFSRFSKIIIFNPISIEDKIKIIRKCYSNLICNIEQEDKELIRNNNILSIFENAVKSGNYPNMRMLKNDIEDAIYYEILKSRGILKD